MRVAAFALLVACVGERDCQNRIEKAYTLKKWDGTVVETCAYSHEWSGANCIVLFGRDGVQQSMLCDVKSAEFGLPTPPPPAENPRQ
jgi:hypothetical protein